MRGDEKRVVDAFCVFLERDGWSVQREVKRVDVVAERGEARLFAEAKGRTLGASVDVDTLYGQLLRRMPADEVGRARFAVVVPELMVREATRVSPRVRAILNIDVYAVSDDGHVRCVVCSA
ncbi:hypothetical protein [Burkholderia sp. Ac-20365]|uniref:hypothetical protein n=1 Tax=Burkholderia sp. Ac-20365 TaxID=2703897 RepID=UPI00197C78F5|nr:hypothetical protein [Burkholderia sp. Ac-20365]